MKNLRVFGQPITGIKAHKWQRISAIYLMLFTPYLAWQVHNVAIEQNLDFPLFIQQLFTPLFLFLSLISIALLLVHAWVGMRDIMIDYLPQKRVSIWLNLYALFLLLIIVDLTFLAIKLS